MIMRVYIYIPLNDYRFETYKFPAISYIISYMNCPMFMTFLSLLILYGCASANRKVYLDTPQWPQVRSEMEY